MNGQKRLRKLMHVVEEAVVEVFELIRENET